MSDLQSLIVLIFTTIIGGYWLLKRDRNKSDEIEHLRIKDKVNEIRKKNEARKKKDDAKPLDDLVDDVNRKRRSRRS